MRVLNSIDLAGLWAALWPAVAVALLRITDVVLHVFRVVFTVQERRTLSSIAAAAEAGAWLAAAGIVLTNLTPLRAVGYVVGVGLGTAIGVELTRRLRLGMVTVRVYADATKTDGDGNCLDLGKAVARAIHAAGYRATIFRGEGYRGPVDMVLSTVRRREAEQLVQIARDVDPNVFAAIDNAPVPVPGAGSTTGRA